jgi:hypothetical protein
MDMSSVAVGDGYTLRSSGEIYVNAKAIVRVGGVEQMTRRIVGVHLGMDDYYRGVGQNWYAEGNEFAATLAETYDLTVWQVAQVISVLSPQNDWSGRFDKFGNQVTDGNRLCSLNVIKAFVEGGAVAVDQLRQERVANHRGWGYPSMFLGKAIRVLEGQELDWSGAPKTHRFAILLADPTRDDIAVCDTHASRVATGNLGNRYHVVAQNAYMSIEEAYMTAGVILGLPAYAVQAGTWQYAVDGNLYGIDKLTLDVNAKIKEGKRNVEKLAIGENRTITDAHSGQWRIVREAANEYQLYRWLESDQEWSYFGQYRSYISAVKDTEMPDDEVSI